MMDLPHTAMIFAAGYGTRMRSHRDDIPKPLVPVAGRPIIDHMIDALVRASIKRLVINVSYMGQAIEAHLNQRSDIEILFSREESPLETGGGLVKARELLGDAPFYVMNSDIGWFDGGQPMLQRLAEHFDASQEQSCLLLVACEAAHGYDGEGDFYMQPDGGLTRRLGGARAPYVFGGVQLMHPSLLVDAQKTYPVGTAFPFRELMHADMDGHISNMRGLVHDGEWMHIGDAAGVEQAEQCLKRQTEAA